MRFAHPASPSMRSRIALVLIGLLVGIVVPGLGAAPPASATDQPVWYERGIAIDWDENCRLAREVCFPLVSPHVEKYTLGGDSYTEETSLRVTSHGLLEPGDAYDRSAHQRVDEGSEPWREQAFAAQQIGEGEFRLRSSEGCLYYRDRWVAALSSLAFTDDACGYGYDSAIWHLLPIGGKPSYYMIQNRAGLCLGNTDVVDRDYDSCDAQASEQMFQAHSLAQAKVWGALALSYAQARCARGEGFCRFTPTDPAGATTPPSRMANDCAVSDIRIGSPDAATTVSLPREVGTTRLTANPTPVASGTGGSGTVGAELEAAYLRRWGASLVPPGSTPAGVGERTEVPAGEMTWIYTRNFVGSVSGTYSFGTGARRDSPWSFDGTYEVGLRIAVLARGSIAAHERGPFDCRQESLAAVEPIPRMPPSTGDAEATVVTVTGATGDGGPVLTVRVEADTPGVAGTIALVRRDSDGTESELTDGSGESRRVVIASNAGATSATTTYSMPAVDAGSLYVRFVPSDPTRFTGSTAEVRL